MATQAEAGSGELDPLNGGSGGGGAGGARLLNDKLDVQTRHAFVRKVFALVGVQLAFTACAALPFLLHPEEMRVRVQKSWPLLTPLLLAPIGVCCVMCCCP